MKIIYKNKKYQSGVSLSEFILVLALVAIATPILVYLLNLYSQKLSSQQYADKTIAYAKAYTRYLHNPELIKNSCKTAWSTGPALITYQDLQNANYLPLGASKITNPNVPQPVVSCYNIVSGKTVGIQAVMYYVANDYKTNLTYLKQSLLGLNAAQSIGGAAALYTSDAFKQDTIYGIGGGWELKKNDDIFSKNQKIVPNSVVVNLALLPEYATQPSSSSVKSNQKFNNNFSGIDNASNNNANTNNVSDNSTQKNIAVNGNDKKVAGNFGGYGEEHYLYRTEDADPTHPSGDLKNQNTMQADVTIANKAKDPTDKKIAYHGIQFSLNDNNRKSQVLVSDRNGESAGKLSNSDQVTLKNGSLGADNNIVAGNDVAAKNNVTAKKNIAADGDVTGANVSAVNNVTAKNVIAGSVNITETVELASACDDDQLGKIKRASDSVTWKGYSLKMPEFVQGTLLICRKNIYPIYPDGNITADDGGTCSKGNCYLPVTPLKVTYYINPFSKINTFQCNDAAVNVGGMQFNMFSYIDTSSWSINDSSSNYVYATEESPVGRDYYSFSYRAYHGIKTKNKQVFPVMQVTCVLEPSVSKDFKVR